MSHIHLCPLIFLTLLSFSSLIKIDRTKIAEEKYFQFLEQQLKFGECSPSYSKAQNQLPCEGDEYCISGFCYQEYSTVDPNVKPASLIVHQRYSPANKFMSREEINKVENIYMKKVKQYCRPYKEHKEKCVCDEECFSGRCSLNLAKLTEGRYCRKKNKSNK